MAGSRSALHQDADGAYTGACTGADGKGRKGREGKFKLADGGTLLLDEIGDMPLALQSKLLRVLQEQELEPLGSQQVIRVDELRPLPEQIAALERQAIAAAVASTQGNKAAAAKLLQVSRAALYDKLALYGTA